MYLTVMKASFLASRDLSRTQQQPQLRFLDRPLCSHISWVIPPFKILLAPMGAQLFHSDLTHTNWTQDRRKRFLKERSKI
jgi:hypothetical protein